MLFSSCKAPFISEVQAECGVKLAKKVGGRAPERAFQIEVDARDKLDADALRAYVRPVVQQEQKPAVRPPRPGGGPRRLPPKLSAAD